MSIISAFCTAHYQEKTTLKCSFTSSMLLLRLLKLSLVESVVSFISAFGIAHLICKGDHNCFKDGVYRFLKLFLVGSVVSI